MVRKKSKWRGLLVALSLITWTSCKPVSSRESLTVAAGTLAREYERSSADVRSKYDGHEITVSGYVLTSPTMPRGMDAQGSVFLHEKELKSQRQVACWFGQSQVEHFSAITAGQLVTVKGVFNGEAGLELKFCKFVKVE